MAETWWSEAACIGQPPEPWFPPRNARAHVSAYAMRFCEACPVRHPCLVYAIRNHEPGTWGGTSEVTRRRRSPRTCALCGAELSPSERATVILKEAPARCEACGGGRGRVADLTDAAREKAKERARAAMLRQKARWQPSYLRGGNDERSNQVRPAQGTGGTVPDLLADLQQ